MDKNLLVIGGGIESVPGILTAKKMGLKVIVSDINPNAPAFDFSDYKIISSTYDVEGTVSNVKTFNKKIKIHGVISLAADVPMTVSAVAKELNLKSTSIKTSKISSDKFLMKQVLKKKNIPIPKFWKINSKKQLEKILLKSSPVVIKPLNGRGARGVQMVKTKSNIDKCFNESMRFSHDGNLIVEEFLHGKQFSTEALIIDGKGYNLGFTDRNYEFIEKFNPFIIENGGDMPTSISSHQKELVEKTAIEAGLAIGIKNGVVKGDMVLTDNGPKVIEIASRLSGGYFSSNQIPLNTGINIVKYAIKIALNIKFNVSELIPFKNDGVAIRYFFPPSGLITDIKNLSYINGKGYVKKFELFVKVGDRINHITDHTKRAGFVITTGKTKNEALERANDIINKIEIITSDVL